MARPAHDEKQAFCLIATERTLDLVRPSSDVQSLIDFFHAYIDIVVGDNVSSAFLELMPEVHALRTT
jgi:hypothetical protein